jgi:hypothetical protein
MGSYKLGRLVPGDAAICENKTYHQTQRYGELQEESELESNRELFLTSLIG